MLLLLIQPLPTLLAKARASGRDSDELKVSADVIGADMFNLNVSRALLRGGPLAWGEQGGVVLELYKRHVPIAVDAGSVFMYGRPLAANGHEQAIYVVNLTAEYPAVTRRYARQFCSLDGIGDGDPELDSADKRRDADGGNAKRNEPEPENQLTSPLRYQVNAPTNRPTTPPGSAPRRPTTFVPYPQPPAYGAKVHSGGSRRPERPYP